MPILIKKVEGLIQPNIIGDVIYLKSVNGQVQREDYVNVNGFTAYLQNMSRMEFTQLLQKPISFGLKNSNSIPSTTLEISY